MFERKGIRSSAMYAAMALFLSFAAACDDDDPVTPEPNVETMRLTVGDQTVLIDASDGSCTGCPLVLSSGATITSAFLLANGEPDPVVTSAEFRLKVEIPSNSVGLLFALGTGNPFIGTFTATGTTATPFNVTFGLHHIPANHAEFEWAVQVIVE